MTDMKSMTSVSDETFQQQCVDRTLRYIRQPSVSSENRGMDGMVGLLLDDIGALGAKVEAVPTDEFPVVFAHWDVGARRTLLLHGLYDTAPASDAGWLTPPFEPRVMEIEPFGPCVVGRGAEDAKAALAVAVTLLHGYHAARRTPPVNIMFVLEASEIGSSGMSQFIAEHGDRLRGADGVYWLFPMGDSDGTPIVPLGLKGQLMGRFTCRGGDWGGPVGTDIHGLHVNWIANPAEELAGAISTLKDRDGVVRVPGYTDDVHITEAQHRQVRTLATQLDPAKILARCAARRFRQTDFEHALAAHCFQSELTITGVRAGYVSHPGDHTIIIPCEAVANVSLRFLPGQDPMRVAEAIQKHLRDTGYAHVHFEVDAHYRGGGSPEDHPLVQCYLRALADVGVRPQIWPVHSTGMPVGLFVEDLRLPWIGGVPIPAGGKHAVNEFAQIAGMRTAGATMHALFRNIATQL